MKKKVSDAGYSQTVTQINANRAYRGLTHHVPHNCRPVLTYYRVAKMKRLLAINLKKWLPYSYMRCNRSNGFVLCAQRDFPLFFMVTTGQRTTNVPCPPRDTFDYLSIAEAILSPTLPAVPSSR